MSDITPQLPLFTTSPNDPAQEIPYGYCHCGCGQKTKIADKDDKRYDWIKGQPRRFLRGHCGRVPQTENSFWAMVDRRGVDDCWLWLGSKSGANNSGYGKFKYNAKHVSAHRLSYEFTHGPIPEGMLICHKCDNPPCVNPNHLFVGTYQDNADDMIAKGRQQRACGENASRAKLTDEQVIEIRRRYAAGGITQGQLATEYGISKDTMWHLLNHKTWKHIP